MDISWKWFLLFDMAVKRERVVGNLNIECFLNILLDIFDPRI